MLGFLSAILAVYQPFFALFIAGIFIADLFGKIDDPKSRKIPPGRSCAAPDFALSFLPEAGSRLMYDNRTRVHGRGRCPVRAGKASV